MSYDLRNKRPERRRRATKPDDSGGWLVTFSDLVLQLFAFVVVAAVLARNQSSAASSPDGLLQRAAATLAGVASPIQGIPLAVASRPAPSARHGGSLETPPTGKSMKQVGARACAPVSLQGSQDLEVAPALLLAPTDSATMAEVLLNDEPQTAPEAPAGSVASAPAPGTDSAAARGSPPADASSSKENRPSNGPRPPSSSETWRGVGQYLEALLGDERGAAGLRIEASGEGVLLRIGEASGFPSGGAELQGPVQNFVRAVGALAADLPELLIEVAGHSDDRPIQGGRFASNLELSFARAQFIAAELMQAEPTLAGRVLVAGWGADRPLVRNDSDEARATNRRVEIHLRAAG